jgi:predicted PurR-regulated permease PerM
MPFPPPSERQAHLLWAAATAVAVTALVMLLVSLVWATSWVLKELSGVIWPLAFAGVLAYLLDPVVATLQRRVRIPRSRAILLVFFLGVMMVMALAATVVPQIIVETKQLADQIPTYAERLKSELSAWLAQSHMGARARQAWESDLGQTVQAWLTRMVPQATRLAVDQLGRVASWLGVVLGLALVPVYLFYFLLEKQGIEKNWRDYLPLRESQTKEEAVFVLTAINDCLIVFFRGQVLVAMCDGALLTLGFLLLGLDYALLLGLVAGMLSIIPYLGVMLGIIPALVLALVQFGNIWGPVMVIVLFGLVQAAEGLYISPKIIGDRVGLHPLTIIISVMVGTSMLGGLLGGLLAIPLTAAIRTLMFRYVWHRGLDPGARPTP